jgi:hypothetical protein
MADKYEREIDEILSRIDDFPRHAARRKRLSNRVLRRAGTAQRGFAVRLARISVSQVMLTAMGLIVVSYFLRSVLHGLWVYAMVLGLILFFTAFVLSFRNSDRGPGRGQPYYRGQPRSYYESREPSVVDRLRTWWSARGRGRR